MLLSLPEELQILVLQHLALPGYKWSDSDDWPQRDLVPEHLASLSNVCLVSKNLHRLAWPILYRAFTNAEMLDRSSESSRLESSMFLRTICLKPEYGLALRSLSIDLCTPIGAMPASELFELLQGDATLAALFQWKARSFCFEGLEQDHDDSASTSSSGMLADEDTLSSLLRSLNMQLPEAQMALLLLLCPKIKDLHIRPGLSRGSTVAAKVLGSILEAAVNENYQETDLSPIPADFEQEESDYVMAQMFGSPWPEQRVQKLPTLQYLEKLSIYGSILPRRGVASFKDLLVAIPSLRTLELLQFQGEPPVFNGNFPLSACAKLEKLSFLECELDTGNVLEILRHCPNLTELELDWVIGWENFTGTRMAGSSKEDWRLRLGEIVDALPTCVPNLELLKLSSAQLRSQNPSSEHPYTIGTALTRLSRLAYLKLDHSAIYGPHDSDSRTAGQPLSELLPKSINYLEIGSNAFSGEPGEEIQPVDAWENWQIADLNHLLQDESFRQLYHLHLELDDTSARRHIHQDTMLRHGWRLLEDNPENWVFKIENPGRA